MITIAICDDDSAVVGEIGRLIRESQIFSEKAAAVTAFASGAELCAALDKDKYFDLIYMDIEMDDVDGITTGQLLRDRYGYDSTLLIYVSSHTKYHGRLFDVQPFQFIQKPVDPDEFARKLKLAVSKIERGNEVFIYKKGHGFFQVKKKDIVYLESRGHHIILSVAGAENVKYRGVFKDEAEKLDNTFFIQPHAAYIININHVRAFEGAQIVMDNGGLVSVSRHRARDVKMAFMDFGEK